MNLIKDFFVKNKRVLDNLLWAFLGFISLGLIGYLLLKKILLIEVVHALQIEHHNLTCQLEVAEGYLEGLKNYIAFAYDIDEIMEKRIAWENRGLHWAKQELIWTKYMFYLAVFIAINMFSIPLFP